VLPRWLAVGNHLLLVSFFEALSPASVVAPQKVVLPFLICPGRQASLLIFFSFGGPGAIGFLSRGPPQ